MRTIALAVALCVVSVAAQAEQPVIQPQGIQAVPGEYQGFLDWTAHQHFTLRGVSDQIVDDFMKCGSEVSYAMMSAVERSTIDAAASGNGMTPAELQAFSENFTSRLSADTIVAKIRSTCGQKFTNFIESAK